MNFKKLYMKNFFSYGPDGEYLDLSKPGLYLVTGENGVGKSTIFEGVNFALFGKITKDMNLPDIVNEKAGKNCRVELHFDDYWIVRYRNDKKHYNNCYLYKGRKDPEHLISKANLKDTQEMIDNILKFNFKSFINAVMMSQENIKGFLEADPGKKKEIIENILQLNIITKYHWVSTEKRKITRKKLDTSASEVQNLENLIENIKSSMTEYIKSCLKQKEENKNNIEKLEKQLEKINTINIEEELEKIRQAEALSIELENKMTEYRHQADKTISLENELETLNGSRLEYRELLKQNKKNIKQVERDTKGHETRIEYIKEEIENIQLNPEECPVCGNLIEEDKLEEHLEDKHNEIERIEDNIENKERDYKDMLNKYKEWTDKVKEYDVLITKLNRNIKKEKIESEELKKHYEEIKIPDTLDLEYLNKFANNKVKLESNIKQLKKKEFVDESYLDKLTEQGVKISDELKDKKKEVLNLTKRLMIIRWWEISLSSKKRSLKSWCTNNIIGYFNARIKHFIDRFFDGDVEVVLDSELTEEVTRKDYERTFGMFSGGEKKRLNLAILFALNSLVKANISTKINIMFFDELLSNTLDDKGISTVLEILEEKEENKDTVYIIEHRDHFKDYPSFKHIKIIKDKQEFSRIKTA